MTMTAEERVAVALAAARQKMWEGPSDKGVPAGIDLRTAIAVGLDALDAAGAFTDGGTVLAGAVRDYMHALNGDVPDPGQDWFWTAEWLAGEFRSDAELARKGGGEYRTAAEFVASLADRAPTP